MALVQVSFPKIRNLANFAAFHSPRLVLKILDRVVSSLKHLFKWISITCISVAVHLRKCKPLALITVTSLTEECLVALDFVSCLGLSENNYLSWMFQRSHFYQHKLFAVICWEGAEWVAHVWNGLGRWWMNWESVRWVGSGAGIMYDRKDYPMPAP